MFVSYVSLHAGQLFVRIKFYHHLTRKLHNYRGFTVSHNSQQPFYVAVNRHSITSITQTGYFMNSINLLVLYLVF